MVDRTVELGLLDYCRQNNITLIAYSPLDFGMDNMRKIDRDDVLGKVAAEAGKTRAQIALSWCIARDVVVAIPKANQIAHVRENCGASGWSLKPEQLKILDEGMPFRQQGPLVRAGWRLARRIGQRFGKSI